MSAKVKAQERLAALADELRSQAGSDRYINAAGHEWTKLPKRWRMVLLLVAEVGGDDAELATLAARSWREMPPLERFALQFACRHGRTALGRLKNLIGEGAVTEPGSARASVIEKINALRNYAAGAFVDAARNEWASLNERWRMAMLLLAGVGGDEELPVLAAKSWRTFADHEQQALRSACVEGLHYLGRANALAARV